MRELVQVINAKPSKEGDVPWMTAGAGVLHSEMPEQE